MKASGSACLARRQNLNVERAVITAGCCAPADHLGLTQPLDAAADLDGHSFVLAAGLVGAGWCVFSDHGVLLRGLIFRRAFSAVSSTHRRQSGNNELRRIRGESIP